MMKNAAKPQQRLWATLTAACLGMSVMSIGACGYVEPETTADLASVRQGMTLLSFTDLGSAIGSPVVSGSTLGAANEVEVPLSCIGGNPSGLGGSDLSYKWTAPSAAAYTFNTAGSGATGFTDTVLHIYDFNTNAILGCNDNVAPADLNSSLILNLSAGQQIRIVVDTFGQGVHHDFKLNILVTCPTAPSQCLASPGTWNGTACFFAPKPAGASCNDGNACTLSDVCNGSGTCGGTPKSCNSPPGPCYQGPGTCNPGTGACSYSPAPAGTDCSPNECWTATCNGAGSCHNNNWLCDTGEICRYGTCMPKY